MKAEIEGIEVLGPESLIHLRMVGVEETIIVRVATDRTLPVTGPIEFEVDVAYWHSFER